MIKKHSLMHIALALFVLVLGFYFIIVQQPTMNSAVIVDKDPFVYCIHSEGGEYNGVIDIGKCCSVVPDKCVPLDGKLELRYNEGIFTYYADYICLNNGEKTYISEGIFRSCIILPN